MFVDLNTFDWSGVVASARMWFMGVTALEMMNALRELSEGLFLLPEIFTALVHLFGSKGYANRGLEILAAMDKLNYDILTGGTYKKQPQADANKMFLKGVESRLRATDEIYDLLIEEDCKAADHSNASRDLKQEFMDTGIKPDTLQQDPFSSLNHVFSDFKSFCIHIWLLFNFTFERIVNAFVPLIAPMSRLLKFVIQLLTVGQNIRKFVKDGFIMNKPTKIHSRSHARRMKEAKRKGRHSGYAPVFGLISLFLRKQRLIVLKAVDANEKTVKVKKEFESAMASSGLFLFKISLEWYCVLSSLVNILVEIEESNSYVD
ncbi:plastid transcriptionally active 3 [Tanacetum coccineum]